MTTKITKDHLNHIPNTMKFHSKKHTCKSCNTPLSSFTATCSNPKCKKNSHTKYKKTPGRSSKRNKKLNNDWQEFLSKGPHTPKKPTRGSRIQYNDTNT